MKKLHLELGGKDAFIVAEDADLAVAVPGVTWQLYSTRARSVPQPNAFMCKSPLLIAFIDELQLCEKSALGPGIDPETDMGPLIGIAIVRGWRHR